MLDPVPDLAPLNRAARRGELSAEALVDLFRIMWSGLNGLSWCAGGGEGYVAARQQLASLEEPLMDLVSELEVFPDGRGADDPEARLDRIGRARDINTTWRRSG